MTLSENPPSCIVCSKPCESSCGACKKVSYCGKQHQKLHWKVHKASCFPATIQSNETLGRHLVATRNIKQGEIVFREKPLISGPNGSLMSWPVCLSCYRVVQTDYTCSKCHWPVCTPQCEMDSLHAQNECEIFAKREVTPLLEHELYKYETITVLRGVLLKDRDPDKWQKVLDLQSHAEERERTLKGKHLSQTAIKFVRDTCGQRTIDEYSIDHVLGALGVNAFVSDDGVTPAMLYRNGSYLYYNGSMPAHSCVSNSSWVIQPNGDFQLRASVTVQAGENITQLYTQPTFPTRERRKNLRESKYFSCCCQRCGDPTELGTNFSSVKCPGKNCSEGYLVASQPLVDDITSWHCNSCGISKKDNFVSEVVGRLKKELNSVGREDSAEAVEKLETILKKHKGVIVHSNHYVVHEIENDIVQRISYLLSASKISKLCQEKYAKRIVELSRSCIAISDVIWPGFSRYRGRLLYFLQQGLTILLVLQVSNAMRKKVEISKEDLRKQFEDLLQMRKEILLILSVEPEGREESYIANAMAEDSMEIKILKKHFQFSIN